MQVRLRPIDPWVEGFGVQISLFDPRVKAFEVRISLFDPWVKAFEVQISLFDPWVKGSGVQISLFDPRVTRRPARVAMPALPGRSGCTQGTLPNPAAQPIPLRGMGIHISHSRAPTQGGFGATHGFNGLHGLTRAGDRFQA